MIVKLLKTIFSSRSSRRCLSSRQMDSKQTIVLQDSSIFDRADWVFDAPNFGTVRQVLEFGSGPDTDFLVLSQMFNSVYWAGSSADAVKLHRTLSEKIPKHSIRLVCCDFQRLPFRSNSFDIISLSRIWNHDFNDPARPRSLVKQSFIRSVATLIKSDGCLYLGASNRFGITEIGNTVAHFAHDMLGVMRTLVPFTSDFLWAHERARLSRHVSNDAHRDHCSRDALTLAGYTSFLKQAGLRYLSVRWTTSHPHPRLSGTFHAKSLRLMIRHLLINRFLPDVSLSLIRDAVFLIGRFIPSICLPTLARWFAPSFLIFASVQPISKASSCWIRPLVGHCGMIRASSRVGSGSFLSIFVCRHSSIEVVRFPRLRSDSTAVVLQAKRLQQFNHGTRVALCKSAGLSYAVTPWLGRSSVSRNWLRNGHMVADWLYNFQRSTTTEKEVLIEEELRGIMRRIANRFERFEHLQFYAGKVVDRIVLLSRGQSLSSCAEHGDFWRGNVRLSSTRCYVIDWEDYQENGNPLFDVGFITLVEVLGVSRSSLSRLIYPSHSMWNGVGRFLRRFAISSGIGLPLLSYAPAYSALRRLASMTSEEAKLDIGYYEFAIQSWGSEQGYGERLLRAAQRM